MGVKAFRVIGMKSGKKFLKIRTASIKNQDLRYYIKKYEQNMSTGIRIVKDVK